MLMTGREVRLRMTGRQVGLRMTYFEEEAHACREGSECSCTINYELAACSDLMPAGVGLTNSHSPQAPVYPSVPHWMWY